MKPTELSRELRHGSGEFLDNRRGIVVASLNAIGCMGLIALYQKERTFPVEPPTRRRDAATTISIIVPVLNEAAGVRRFLETLRKRAPGAEVIVVDGGSDDATREIAGPLSDLLLTSARGRAAQMNVGANAATGDVFWFLHADVEPPLDCLAAMEQAIQRGAVGGYFRIRLPRSSFVYRFTDSFAHHAGKLLRMRCGDHGFFCRRDVFEQIGGFPEVPLMEDVEFYRALRRCGRVVAVDRRLVVSPRRYERVGPVRLTFAYGLIAALYACGAPWRFLASLYKQLCSVR